MTTNSLHIYTRKNEFFVIKIILQYSQFFTIIILNYACYFFVSKTLGPRIRIGKNNKKIVSISTAMRSSRNANSDIEPVLRTNVFAANYPRACFASAIRGANGKSTCIHLFRNRAKQGCRRPNTRYDRTYNKIPPTLQWRRFVILASRRIFIIAVVVAASLRTRVQKPRESFFSICTQLLLYGYFSIRRVPAMFPRRILQYTVGGSPGKSGNFPIDRL